jgi:hypothetical protein
MSDFRLNRPGQKAVPTIRSIIVRTVVAAVLGLGILVATALRLLDMAAFNWVSLVFLLVGLFLLVLAGLAAKDLPVARELNSRGAMTEGTIVSKRTRTDSEGDRTCYVAYDFGDGYGAEQQVSYRVYRRLNVGDRVAVRYLSRDLYLSRLEV